MISRNLKYNLQLSYTRFPIKNILALCIDKILMRLNEIVNKLFASLMNMNARIQSTAPYLDYN